MGPGHCNPQPGGALASEGPLQIKVLEERVLNSTVCSFWVGGTSKNEMPSFYGLGVNSEFHLDLYILRITELSTAKHNRVLALFFFKSQKLVFIT